MTYVVSSPKLDFFFKGGRPKVDLSYLLSISHNILLIDFAQAPPTIDKPSPERTLYKQRH
jgi:hypothetical protein